MHTQVWRCGENRYTIPCRFGGVYLGIGNVNNMYSMKEGIMNESAKSATLTEEKPGTDVQSGAVTSLMVEEFQSNFESEPANFVAQNAVTKTSVVEVALNRSVLVTMDHTFSNQLDDWKVTNQKQSGRCWMFAGLNLFRAGAMKAMNVKEFEFSQNYTLFWDKFERANYFLEAILETAADPVDDRTVSFLLDRPLDDGGQWNMFVNIVRKHGLVPKSAMPETQSSSATMRMNRILLEKLREGARTLRDLKADGSTSDELQAEKNAILEIIFRILCIHLGTPPTSFNWQWRDKDKKFHRDGKMTPIQFAEKYITIPLDEYICIVHDPRAEHPTNQTYTVKYLGNVMGGAPVIYLNVDIETMKQLTIQAIEDDEPVWMGCDVGQMMDRDQGVWDAKLFDFGGLYRTDFTLTKTQRLHYHQTQMTHAMLFTGVDLIDGVPQKWRVENSWGDENGKKGFYVMNDSWFDEYMFEIAARKSRLTPELLKALETEPVVLNPWDPMGSLAR